MHKIKSLFDPNTYDTGAFVTLSAAMVLCFIAGAALVSFSVATVGFIVMSAGLLLSTFIGSVFLADYLR